MTPNEARYAANEFNRLYPVGTPVRVMRNFKPHDTRVRAPAEVHNGCAVAWFAGIPGPFVITGDRVFSIPEELNLNTLFGPNVGIGSTPSPPSNSPDPPTHTYQFDPTFWSGDPPLSP